MRMRRGGARGFTIVELMVVLAIIGLLAAVAVPYYFGTLQRAKENTLKHDLRIMRDMIQQYKVDKKKFPPDPESLVSDKYLREIPKDPVLDAVDWEWIHNEPEDPDDPDADRGIVDVKSKAPGVDHEGVPFSEY